LHERSALQGLLRKIGGAGFDGGMPGTGLSHSRFKVPLVRSAIAPTMLHAHMHGRCSHRLQGLAHHRARCSSFGCHSHSAAHASPLNARVSTFGVDSAHKLQSILVALREADDETAQLSALHDLCEMLAISTEESLSVFPVDQLIPILVRQPVLGSLLSREC